MDKNKRDLSSEKALEQELEEVRALFEETLKSETERAEHFQSEEELIQSLEDIKEPSPPKKTKGRNTKECECCGEILPEKAFAEGKDFCENCRKAMRRYPIRARGIITAVVMAVVFFGSMITSMDSVMDISDMDSVEYEDFLQGYAAYSENELISAAAHYGSYLAQRQGKTNVSMTAVRQLTDSYCSLGEYPYAAQLIEEYFSDFELKMPWNIKYQKILEKNELYSETYSKIIELLKANSTEDGYDYEATVSQMLQLKSQTDSEGEKLYSDYLLDIFALEFSASYNSDSAALYERLLEIDKEYGRKESEHLPMLCRYAALAGDKKVVEDCYERMTEINSQNMSIYGAYFNYFRYLENPDTEKMLEICQKMAEVSGEIAECGQYNYDYLYYLAITYMLKGDAGESSFNMMEELYSCINYYGSYYSGNSKVTDIFNLYALTALYTGNTEAYEWAKEELEYLGYEMSDLIEKYAKGEMTAAEVLADKGGDIA